MSGIDLESEGGMLMNQIACWEYAFGKHNGGERRIKCFACRKVCPHCLGISYVSGSEKLFI
jgi:hypothetical protein